MNHEIFIPNRKMFEEILERKVDDLLTRRIPEIVRKSTRKEYITTAEFKELTGCSHRVQQYYRNEGLLAYSQEGKRKIWYKMTDVEKFMADRRVEAKGEG